MSSTTNVQQTPSNSRQQNATITLYWLEKSRSQRILWLLEELNLKYELKTYKRVNTLAPPELKEIHPLGKPPLIGIQAEGQTGPRILAESGLITEYLIDHFGPELAPKRYYEGSEGKVGAETESWIRYRYFMHYGEGTLMTYLIVALLVSNIRNGPVPFFLKPITNGIANKIDSMFLQPNFKTNYEFLESQLATSSGDFLCGDELTGADIMMSFPLSTAKGRSDLTQEKYPKIWAYVDRLESRNAFKRAV